MSQPVACGSLARVGLQIEVEKRCALGHGGLEHALCVVAGRQQFSAMVVLRGGRNANRVLPRIGPNDISEIIKLIAAIGAGEALRCAAWASGCKSHGGIGEGVAIERDDAPYGGQRRAVAGRTADGHQTEGQREANRYSGTLRKEMGVELHALVSHA